MKELEELTQEIREKLPRLIYIEILDFTYYKYKAKRFREPMLNDVMEWLLVKSQSDFEPADKRYLTHFLAFKLSEWDLSKPFLKDQSPELIKFLHGLIKK
ncbi:hypothetical protein [Chryseobacterium indologenes]|uniref:hypothetical protein n=1 Tax=Chryseobacterium indologenes TaxID=253 RepID=UPI003D33FD60